jgi:uroporphyrin-III C-methyltransferase / precorrin-2 dehydrogenase / sirohydrochlorin ferrochelatase
VTKPESPAPFPVFLNLQDRPCTVIGGGEVAARKVRSLLASGAQVSVIAPELSTEMAALQDDPRVHVVPRVYQPGDLRACVLAFAATDDAEVNAAVYRDAMELGLLVNVVDDPPHCSFIVPSQLQRGPITIAVSTGGASPVLARHVRQRVEAAVPPVYGELAELLGRLRAEVKADGASMEERLRRWESVLSSDVLALLEQGKAGQAEALARELLGLAPTQEPRA